MTRILQQRGGPPQRGPQRTFAATLQKLNAAPRPVL